MDKEKGVNEYGHGVAWYRGSLLGKGAFGSVYLATLKNPNSKYSYYPSLMAVKSAEVSASCSIQKEREVLNNIQGCNSVIRCYGDETTMGENGTMVYNLLLEYGSGGTLTHKIKTSVTGKLPEIEVRSYARSILRGLIHIHNLGYVHCDLKPDNILIVPVKGVETGNRAKIGDFGLAKREKQSKKRKLQPYWRGTPMYLSPEAVTDSVQDAPSDIWAFGCIVLEMLTGKPPWDRGEDEILKRIGEGKELPNVPNEVSKEAKDFLKCCFVRKPMFRFTAEMLLDHPFVEGLSDGNGIEEVEEVEDLIEGESMLVASLSSYEFSGSFGSNEGLASYLSNEEEYLDDVSSNFAEEGKLRVEDIETVLGQSNTKEISLEVAPKRRKDFAVGYVIPLAAV